MKEEQKRELEEKLLGIAGDSVEFPENVSESLIKFGHLLEYDVMQVPGGTSRLYMDQQENQNIRVVSGFALMEDNVWHSHAWLVLDNCGYKIIDNINALKYFGVVMPY